MSENMQTYNLVFSLSKNGQDLREVKVFTFEIEIPESVLTNEKALEKRYFSPVRKALMHLINNNEEAA